MRLLAISDLHIGYPENRAYADALAPADPEDWLIVAGDVGEVFADVGFVLASLANRFAKVIWAPGNHELWTLPSDPVAVRGVARYEALVKVCRRFGVLTPEDEFPVWDGPGGPVTVAPLLALYDYSFGPDRATAATRRRSEGGARCGTRTPPGSSPPTRDACSATPTGRWRTGAGTGWRRPRRGWRPPAGPLVLASHWPLIPAPLAKLRHPAYAPWCGTTLTADWHTRYPVLAAVYGHLHIPRTARVRRRPVRGGLGRQSARVAAPGRRSPAAARHPRLTIPPGLTRAGGARTGPWGRNRRRSWGSGR